MSGPEIMELISRLVDIAQGEGLIRGAMRLFCPWIETTRSHVAMQLSIRSIATHDVVLMDFQCRIHRAMHAGGGLKTLQGQVCEMEL